jgi:hypothetical protein
MRLAWLRRPKILCSPSNVDFRSRENAVVLLNLGHTLRREHIKEVWGWVGNPKLQSVWCHLCRGANTVTVMQQRSIKEDE